MFVPAAAFPRPPLFLNDLVADAKGYLYVTDSGDLKGEEGAVYCIDPFGKVFEITNYRAQSPPSSCPTAWRLTANPFS